MGGRVGRLDGVAALVDQAVHVEPVGFPRGNHELPKSGRAHPRGGTGIEGRLNDGKVFEFERKLVAFQGFFEDGNIEIVGSQHVGDGTAQAGAILVNEFPHHFVVGHLNDVRQAVEARDVFLFAVFRVLVRTFALFVNVQIIPGVPFMEQAVYFIRHAFGQVDDFVFSRPLVVHGDVVLGLQPHCAPCHHAAYSDFSYHAS